MNAFVIIRNYIIAGLAYVVSVQGGYENLDFATALQKTAFWIVPFFNSHPIMTSLLALTLVFMFFIKKRKEASAGFDSREKYLVQYYAGSMLLLVFSSLLVAYNFGIPSNLDMVLAFPGRVVFFLWIAVGYHLWFSLFIYLVAGVIAQKIRSKE